MGLIKTIFILILLFLVIMLGFRLARADSVTDIINVTVTVNSSSVMITMSGNVYSFNNSNQTSYIQQNYSVSFITNITNATIISNITCSNASISLSCSCPSCPSLPSLINSSCDYVGLNNATKTEFYNHYVTSLSGKIEESGNKVAQDILFQLQPTKVQLDECKQTAVNASLKEQEAYRIRDKFAADNVALGVSYQSVSNELKTLQVIFFSFIGFLLISYFAHYGFWERRGKIF